MANTIDEGLEPHENGGGGSGINAAGDTAMGVALDGAPPAFLDGTFGDSFGGKLLTALSRFKDGDFSSRLPSTLVGVEGKIADVFNDILAVSARRALE